MPWASIYGVPWSGIRVAAHAPFFYLVPGIAAACAVLLITKGPGGRIAAAVGAAAVLAMLLGTDFFGGGRLPGIGLIVTMVGLMTLAYAAIHPFLSRLMTRDASLG